MPELRVAVVVPAYCEEALIQKTITGLPEYVTRIIVVDDGSPDDTAHQAGTVPDARVSVVRHNKNRGVGAAIYTGYRAALESNCDAFVVLAGDNQMDHADLSGLLEPIAENVADYVKGNRLVHPRAGDMPRLRRWGTRCLGWLTSLACRAPLGDSQCGYTAISRHAALHLDWTNLWLGYGYPNDLLIALSARGMRIAERPVRPVYATEKSGLRPWHFLSILRVIARRLWIERGARRRRPSPSPSPSQHSATPALPRSHAVVPHDVLAPPELPAAGPLS